MRSMLLLLALLARADQWAPPEKTLYSDETRRWLVLVDPTTPGDTEFVFARAAKPRPAPGKDERGRERPLEPALRKDDAVLARGTLPQTPYYLLVSTSGAGFAAVENYGMLGSGFAVIWVSSAGKFTAGVELEGLFSKEEMRRFGRSVSNTWWLADSWLDEAAGKVLVVATTGLARGVSLAGGKVAPATAEELLRAVASGADHARPAADCLVIGAASLDPGPLAAAYADAKAPPFARLAAAAALAARGDRRGQTLLDALLAWKGGPALGMGYDEQAFLVGHLPAVFGDRAPALLRRQLEAGIQAEEAVRGLVQLGQPGIQALLEVAGSTRASVLARHEAIRFFEKAEVEEAIPTLARIAWEKEGLVGGSAVTALGRIRRPEAGKALNELLRKGCPHVEELMLALFWARDSDTSDAVRAAVKLWPKGSKQRAVLDEELRKYPGEQKP